MLIRNKFILLFIILFFCNANRILPQKSNDIKINVSDNFDIRKTSAEYFGNADLWQYILKYNNIKSLSELKTGSSLLIPQDKVKKMLSKLEEANKSFQEAVLIGAKILAEEFLTKSNSLLQQATKQRDSFEYDSVEKLADESITASKAAYKKTKEIREKTLDAIISFKRGKVQKMFPSILKWEEAELYDNLKENDWARTLTLSNANITFYDLSQIKLNENSQAIIQSSKYDVIDNKTTTKVKLEKGDAYAMLESSPKKKFDLDIKGVKTKINSKYFWVEKGTKSTKLSNYNGEIALQVKDSAVVVHKNQGSIIPDGGFPTKPKKLIASPELLQPMDLTKLDENQAIFTWAKVDKAINYWLEISSDPNFKRVYKDIKNINEDFFKLTNIEAGIYYWHVCAIDSLGLPGPYSYPRILVLKIDSSKPFLEIEFPSSNYVSTKNKIKIVGTSEFECKVTINNDLVIQNDDGKFQKELTLQDGKNSLIITSVNKSGAKTEIARNIFYESSSDVKVTDKNSGEFYDQKKIETAASVLKLELNSRPFSRIDIKSVSRNWSTVNYTDSLGNCNFNLNVDRASEEFSLHVKTPAQFEKIFSFIVQKGNIKPKITFEPEPEYETNQETFVLTGTVENANQFLINDSNVVLDSKGKFSFSESLNKRDNNFVIKAIGNNGEFITVEKRIVFDNHPPRLINYSMQKINKEESLYKLMVKAEDETSLKNYAVVTLSADGSLFDEMVEYLSDKKIYEGVINIVSKSRPEIKSITLEDYLSNKKTYEVGK